MARLRSERNRRVRQYRNAEKNAQPHVLFSDNGKVLRGAGRNNFTYGPNRLFEYYQKVAAARRRAAKEAEAGDE